MKKWLLFPLLPALLTTILVRCVSRTLPEGRLADSNKLQSTMPSPVVADPERFSFAAVGDLHISGGDTARFRRILQLAASEGNAFIVLLGDIVDKGEERDVLAFRQAITETGWEGKAYPVIGNHDVFDDGWRYYLAWNGSANYVFTAGNSKFIALDTADATLGAGQTAWLEEELAKARPTHLFLLSHYLPLIPGRRTYLKFSNEVEAMSLMRTAANHGVTAWLGAHYHSFIVGRVEGVDYVVAGGGGGRRMDPVRDYFYARVEVDGPHVSYHLRTVE